MVRAAQHLAVALADGACSNNGASMTKNKIAMIIVKYSYDNSKMLG